MSGGVNLSVRGVFVFLAMALIFFSHHIAVAEELTAIKLDDHATCVKAIAISPDGSRIASVGDEGLVRFPSGGQATQGVLRVWATASHKTLVVQPYNHQLFAVKFLPLGARFAVGGSRGLYVVQARDGKLLRTFDGVEGWVEAIAVSRDGSTLVSAGGKLVQFWSVNTGKVLKSDSHDAEVVSAVQLTRDNRLLFAGGYANNTTTERKYFVRLWDVGHRARDLQIGFDRRTAFRDAVLIAGDRRVVIAGPSGTIEEWDVQTEKLVRAWASHGAANCLALTRDARYLATASLGGKIQLWDVAAARPISSFEDANLHCTAVAVSDDAQQIVVGTMSGEVCLVSRSLAGEGADQAPAELFQINAGPR